MQFATGSRTFAPRKNYSLGEKLLLQLLALIFLDIVNTFCAPCKTKSTPKILVLGVELLLGRKFNFEA